MRIPGTERGQRCLLGWAAAVLASTLWLGPSTARAVDVSVDCDSGGSLQAAINSLDLQGYHTITVTGTCHQRVNIIDRERVTIQAPEGMTAIIVSPVAGVGNVMSVFGSRAISLLRLVITGGRNGVVVGRLSEVVMGEVTVENNARTGISADGSVLSLGPAVVIQNNGLVGISTADVRLILTGDPEAPNIIQGHGLRGLSLFEGTSATLRGQNIIQNNGDFGVGVFHNSVIELNRATVQGNGQTGVQVSETSHAELIGNVIRENGASGPERSGVRITENAEVFLDGGNEISNNQGPGVLVDADATVSSLGNNTISNNTQEGVRLQRQSLAQFFAADSIFGNGGANLSCDTTSLVAGDLTGVTNIKCMKIERELGPPRPGRLHELPEPPGPPGP